MLEGLTGFDFAIAALVLFMAVAGLARGFVGEVTSLLAWAAGVLAVRFFHADAKLLIAPYIENEVGAAVVALFGLFVLAFVVVRLIGDAMSRRTKASVVGPVDRLLGLGFGAAKGVVAATLLFLLSTMGLELLWPGQPQPLWMRESRAAPALAIVSRALVDFVDEARRLDASLADGADPHAGLGIAPAGGGNEAEGYAAPDRAALDKLLDEQEQSIPSTAI